MKRKQRVLLATPMLDGHNRGIKLVARGLRDANIEVVYLGLLQTPDQIVQAAMQEGSDLIGIGTAMGIHKAVFSDIIELLKVNGADDIKIIGGGAIPKKDIAFLKGIGVSEVFGPGTPIKDIVDYVTALS